MGECGQKSMRKRRRDARRPKIKPGRARERRKKVQRKGNIVKRVGVTAYRRWQGVRGLGREEGTDGQQTVFTVFRGGEEGKGNGINAEEGTEEISKKRKAKLRIEIQIKVYHTTPFHQ